MNKNKILKEDLTKKLLNLKKNKIIYVTSSNKNIEYYYTLLKNKDKKSNVYMFDNSSLGSEDLMGMNIELLDIFSKEKKFIIFINFQIALQIFFEEVEFFDFEKGKEYKKEDISKFLVENMYNSNYIVEKKGEYSIRGEIIDVFPSNSDLPIRLDFFDRELEKIKSFSLDTQRSLENFNKIRIYGNNLKGKYKEFTEMLSVFKSNDLEIIMENKELIDYKLEELVLIDRDSEETLRKRYKNLEEKANQIEVLKTKEKDYNVDILNKENIRRRGIKYKKPNQIKEGDYVIHTQYGIGIYQGLKEMNGNDYLYVKYADDDNLYIPIEKLDRLEKFVGGGEEPVLYKLGRKGFKRKEKKLKEDIEKFAKELINIQVRREKQIGFIYSRDTVWQQEFEEKFPFAETKDQKKAIEDVKKDMETGKIMDRIICGDVGYGKTEIAMRASFKAIENGKQVALIAPTTVLANQHFDRFLKRFEDYPIEIRNLSRLTTKEAPEILKGLKSGTIDMIIGTHRILSSDVNFNNLGLFIIDEEQKFGVKAKETIKKNREKIDVLALTATPIPRTLNLALLGIRDISVIETPPVNRLPIITKVIENGDENEIKNIILKEISRDGQVFYISNDVKNMKYKVKEIEKLLPDFIKVDYINGKLPPKDIKRKVKEFENGEFDILLASTIIENGIDISNANTIIIERFDKLGLSQTYQLRGRVGRSKRQGYCYLLKDEFTTKKGKQKKETIEKIEGIVSGGFQISLDDLKIRGAGEILGQRQHGSIDAFGYDMYIKMLNEEIKKQKGEYVEKIDNVQMELLENGRIPENYIETDERLYIYKRFALLENYSELKELEDEIVDRFGKMPKEMISFIKSVEIKIYCQINNIEKIIQNPNSYDLYIKSNSQDRVNVVSLDEKEFYKRIFEKIKQEDKK